MARLAGRRAKARGLLRLGGMLATGGGRRSRGRTLLMGAAGAAAQYFLDPTDGRRRRAMARDRAAALLRRGSRQAAGTARYASGVAQGAVQQATPGGEREDAATRLNDPALARKVESEIFRDAEAPKGSVSVNAEHGVIYLRGEVADADQIKELVDRAQAVEGVQAVENLLHEPGTPAPSKGDGHAEGRVLKGPGIAE